MKNAIVFICSLMLSFCVSCGNGSLLPPTPAEWNETVHILEQTEHDNDRLVEAIEKSMELIEKAMIELEEKNAEFDAAHDYLSDAYNELDYALMKHEEDF